MRIPLFLLVLCVSWLAQCNARNEHAGNAQTIKTDQKNISSERLKDACDFSSYGPSLVSHFVQFALKTKVTPSYPTEAVQQRIEGKVNVKILVDRDGNVIKACASDGNEILRRVAEDAALQWKFKRDVVAGRQSYVQAGISFNFELGAAHSKNGEAIRP